MAANYDDRNREVTFEIVEEIGIIASASTGWTKELNLVAWNGGQAKYDIREWSPHHDRMSRGITLNEQEMRMIVELLKRRARARSVPRRASFAQSSESAYERDAEREEPAFAKGEDEAAPRTEEPAFAKDDEDESGETDAAAGQAATAEPAEADEEDEGMPF